MSQQTVNKSQRTLLILLLVAFLTGPLMAQRSWKRQEVDLQAGNGRRIKAIRYPANQRPRIEATPSSPRTTTAATGLLALQSTATKNQAVSALSMDINDPPVAGFVAWIALAATDEREGDFVLDAVAEPTLKGSPPSNIDITNDYIIGIFDTGASAHVMGYADAQQLGLYSGGLLTSSETIISGVVGQVYALISQPLGLFADGLGAVDANTAQLNTSYMKGESNVAIMAGEAPAGNNPDLPTAIGPPLSVYYTTHIRNDTPITLTRGNVEYQGPDVLFYDADDNTAPSYDNVIPLELRPLGAVSVQYIPDPTGDLLGGLGGLGGLGDILGGLGGGSSSSDMAMLAPSVLVGIGSQSLFFIHSVDLYEGAHQALDKNRFMLDTGAQVTVIGTRIAARLGLNAADKEFEVEIEGVTGQSVMAPGFTIDRLDIPALGQWFHATNVPVVWMDVSSPEGGTLDGIIGMNLFTEFNLIVKGGGFMLEGDPALELQRINAPVIDPNTL